MDQRIMIFGLLLMLVGNILIWFPRSEDRDDQEVWQAAIQNAPIICRSNVEYLVIDNRNIVPHYRQDGTVFICGETKGE